MDIRCPICGSESYEVLKSKLEKSKGKISRRLLLKCEDCKTVYRETIIEKEPIDCRIIISKHEVSEKKHIKLYPEDILKIGDVLAVDDGSAKITSIETKKGARVKKSIVSDIETIWASSLDIPARIGISIVLNGRTFSKKVEVDRNFEFRVGDIIKLEDFVFKIHTIKTTTARLKRGFAKASVIKRVYGRFLPEGGGYNYDLSHKVVQ